MPYYISYSDPPSVSEFQLSIVSFQMLVKLIIGSIVGESMLFFSLDLQLADLGLPLALQKVSCCCLWFLFKYTDQTPLALQPVSGSYPWIQIEATDQTLGSAECELLLFLAPFQAH